MQENTFLVRHNKNSLEKKFRQNETRIIKRPKQTSDTRVRRTACSLFMIILKFRSASLGPFHWNTLTTKKISGHTICTNLVDLFLLPLHQYWSTSSGNVPMTLMMLFKLLFRRMPTTLIRFATIVSYCSCLSIRKQFERLL